MKVLIATDGSDFSLEAIKKSCRLINTNDNLAIKILSVYEVGAPIAVEPFVISAEYLTEMNVALKNQAEVQVADAVKVIKELLPTVENVTTKVEMGIPEQIIIETAQEWGADLIVVGSHGRGFWGRAMIGSTSDSVIHNAVCPVLVVRKVEGAKVKSTTSDKTN